jgi:transcriptional regulator with XRE-family HTH domain
MAFWLRDFGKAAKTMREARGLSQEALAEACFVSKQVISNLETGRVMLAAETVCRIANALDVGGNLYRTPGSQSRSASLAVANTLLGTSDSDRFALVVAPIKLLSSWRTSAYASKEILAT